ncbi:MAG: DUF4365 domain-containing protein [Burkholderiales bacterium]|nr:DUF4365 domain-containing protein [Burkholderiales bacterium]
MPLPSRINPHVIQSKSFAILLYKLKDFGYIFRNFTENDYGIDFEIEQVVCEQLIGKFIKVQVKASETYVGNNDQTISVSNLKQSTLKYWCNLSFHCHVIIVAIDITNEQMYISEPIFWDACKLLDRENSSKTLRIQANLGTEYNVRLDTIFNKRKLIDTINATKSFLINLKQIVEMYYTSSYHDTFSPIENPEMFFLLLNLADVLIGNKYDIANMEIFSIDIYSGDRSYGILYDLIIADKNKIYDPNSLRDIITEDDGYYEIPNILCKFICLSILPKLVETVIALKNDIIASHLYWESTDELLLRLAKNTQLSSFVEWDNLHVRMR